LTAREELLPSPEIEIVLPIMSVVVITGSAGLVGSESCKWFHRQGFEIAGLDNDMRAVFLGAQASTARTGRALEQSLPRYRHFKTDIRDQAGVEKIFAQFAKAIKAVIHTAAQPSHDWAAREPMTDFGVNAVGTLNMLEATRKHCPEAVFIFTSTNKVYGDLPNHLPLVEL